MNVLIKVIGETSTVGAEEVLEPSADPLHSLVIDVGCAGDGCGTPDGIALTGDVDLELDGRAWRVMAESAQEHSSLGYVFGLAEGAEGTLLEMENDTGRGAEGYSGRHRRQIGDHGFEESLEVTRGDCAVDADPNSDKGFCCRKVIGLGEQQHTGMFAGRARRANAFDKAAQLCDWTRKTDDYRVEFGGLNELQGVVAPGLMVELDVTTANHLQRPFERVSSQAGHDDLSFHWL